MKTLLRATTLVVLLGACADGIFTPRDDDGWTVARVEGSIVSSYEGSGRFDIEYIDHQGGEAIFEIRSEDLLRGGTEAIVIQRFGSRMPTAGRYWFDEYEEFFARYERYRNGRWEWYAADLGTLDIWSATSNRIEGEFRFSAALTCVGDGYTMECATPAPNAPRILVDGSFMAVRGSSYGY